MSFSTDLATDIGVLRALLGDDTDGAGVKPDGTNISDEFLQVLLNREGSVDNAQAAGCEALSRWWAAYAGSLTTGPISESFQQSKAYADLAKSMRAQYGGGAISFAIDMTRSDGYHANNPYVTAEHTEYTTDRIIFIQV